jgi:hypothetical protein
MADITAYLSESTEFRYNAAAELDLVLYAGKRLKYIYGGANGALSEVETWINADDPNPANWIILSRTFYESKGDGSKDTRVKYIKQFKKDGSVKSFTYYQYGSEDIGSGDWFRIENTMEYTNDKNLGGFLKSKVVYFGAHGRERVPCECEYRSPVDSQILQ